ncbi:hypothetical protein [Psychrobacter nivimaris]|uniref:hypothetical protein n=1 Tax=Psychrobacter nivimaris TaxID=281738 RepID=UPI00191A1DC6|nr:hypothetical protein [Psychrobacter nivimaris]
MKNHKNLPRSSNRYVPLSSKDLLSLCIHPEARKAYEIYLEHFPIGHVAQPKGNKVHLDVLYDRLNFYFFDNFVEQLGMMDSTEVHVMKTQPTMNSIELESWRYVWQAFLGLKPVNIKIYNQLKNQMPKDIQRQICGRLLTIEHTCQKMIISRPNFEYQQAKQKYPVFEMPSFDELIQRNVNGD